MSLFYYSSALIVTLKYIFFIVISGDVILLTISGPLNCAKKSFRKANMTFLDSCALLSSRLIPTLLKKKNLLCVTADVFHMDKRNETKFTMELVNIPPIVSTYRHALHTFDDRFKKDLSVNMNKLKLMMDSLKSADLGFDKTVKMLIWTKPNKAPCTYIEVFQNNSINMSIFVLKPGFRMPLHDHPQMHGLLKVISGAVHITSYSEHPLKEVMKAVDAATRAKIEAKRLSQGEHKHRKLFAEITSSKICRDNSSTCILTPTVSNYHEIQALDTPAAFFDILSPPYDTLLQGIGPRRCHYYKVINEISTNLVEMEETSVPQCFFCDQAPYLGPQLA